MKDKTIIEDLAEVYPQLYLDPDREEKEAYRAVVLQGEMPESQSLAHFQQSTIMLPTTNVSLYVAEYSVCIAT